ncbi:hypothetical protein BU204_22095 [Actinophytocola xanthii]|uniref:Uncharacterized protein n=2 Tax=Actinophytocola xanthii TaxID=1912961 RepID=A0A1Q8CLW1_9PSEU|nr:hypothetical protein BU204_22095 [Actinophytocola xanthii]
MLLGGLGVAVVMMGIGAYAVGTGQSVGPDQEAIWPAGTEIGISREFGRRQQAGGEATIVTCAVTPENGNPHTIDAMWGERISPRFTGPASITCEYRAKVLTGGALTTAGITRGPLVAVPLFVAGLGVFFFFPRFTAFAASLSHPFGRLVVKLTGRDRRYWEH